MMKTLALALSSLALAALCTMPVYAKDTSGPVTCTDGTTSPHGGRGACSKHGGIKKDAAPAKAEAAAAAPAAAAKPAAATPAMPAAPAAAAAKPAAAASAAGASSAAHSVNSDAAGAIAKCKDGSYSHAKTHTGACSKHGGVGEWLDGSKK
jgi:hypothetical protein